MKQKIEELEYEREDLIAAKDKMTRERDEALMKLTEWSTKGAPGDQVCAICMLTTGANFFFTFRHSQWTLVT